MKIDLYWDLRSTFPSRHTGVGKHVIEVVRGLLQRQDLTVRVLLAKDQVRYWRQQAEAYDWMDCPTVKLSRSLKGNRLLYGLTSGFSLDSVCRGTDVVYSPMELLLSVKGIPYVNTIHGIPCFESTLPENVYRSSLYRRERCKQAWFLRRTRKLCQSTFVVSDYLRDRLAARFGLSRERMHVVYNGAEEFFYDQCESSAHRERDNDTIRLLVVGGANIFDGAPAVWQISRILATHLPEARILMVGDRHESPWEEQLRAQPNVDWLGFLPSRELRGKMDQSDALLYVPAVESFGIIGVEAMAAGLPILAVKDTALPEVLGAAPCWLDTGNESSVVSAVKKIVTDPDYREERIQAGRKQAGLFHWSSVVDRVVTGLRKVVTRE